MRITSKIDVHVSGRAREVTLRGLLLDGALPLDLKSPLPTRFGPAGELFLQVRPGRWEVRLETRMEGPVSKIGPIGGAFGQEIWSFESQNHLRMVKVQGVPSVDPAQTNVPADWKRFPAFIVRPGAEISFKEIRRGDPEPAPDQLHLKRTWWLDFNGRGFTVHDKITGTMSLQWSLAMNPPGILGHVKIDGQGQLITQQETDKAKKPGVELRRGKLNLTADSRFEASRSLIPAVGWDHDFQSLSARLNLPPGWRLLTAGGVDVIPGTWFERWSLLDLFLILMIAMAVWKLRSWPWGLLALVTLGLVYHEPGAPRLVWLHLLSAAALLRLLSGGWFRKAIKLWFWGAVVGLLVLTIPFMVQQIRIGLYPQLAYPGTSRRISPQAYDKAAAPALEEAQVMVKAPQKNLKRKNWACTKDPTFFLRRLPLSNSSRRSSLRIPTP